MTSPAIKLVETTKPVCYALLDDEQAVSAFVTLCCTFVPRPAPISPPTAEEPVVVDKKSPPVRVNAEVRKAS